MFDQSFANRILVEDLNIQQLLTETHIVGGIFNMGYDECLVLTNDFWKQSANGIPQHCYLLATAMEPNVAPHVEDEEVILLRVIGPASLPAESELVSIRAEAMREIVTTQGIDAARQQETIIDVLTRNEIQFSALRARILGTFYDLDVNGISILAFGNDVETFYSASRYKVYKPYGQSLSIIASYPAITEQEEQQRQQMANAEEHNVPRVKVGTLRYTSTDRRRRRDHAHEQTIDVPVMVNVEDFIALKTAVFGMTRLGKSNTMKILATAIFEHSKNIGERIGQLLFDPAGEYANINVQDETALSQIGSEYVTIFRFGATGDEPGVRPLSINVYSNDDIEVTWAITTSFLGIRNDSNYIQNFLAADVIGPADQAANQSAWNRAGRRRAAFFATLLRAGFAAPPGLSVRFRANQQVVDAVNRYLNPQVNSGRGGWITLNSGNLISWFNALIEAQDNDLLPNDWIDAGMEAILTVFRGSVGSGYRLLTPMAVYHDPNVDSDYAQHVLHELLAGKIVIIDLSQGADSVLQFSSERIINHIVSDAARRFASGERLNNIQIYLEEAHRLFNRDRMSVPDQHDPYVRLAKEAAKFKLGLIYATQEVTSVDPIILSNTSNWIVTHLNNRVEVRELSKYYDFEDFAELTLKAEDVGFVRLKTKSGRYIVPAQIDLFGAERIQFARQRALEADQI